MSARLLRVFAAFAVALVSSVATPIHAADPPAEEMSPDAAALRELSRPPTSSSRLLATVAFGDGLRFNNPYRLSKELGCDKCVSLTSGYVDLGAAVAFGSPNGFQYGGAVRLSIALAGVPQQVLTPTVFLAYRGEHSAMAFARLGPSIILSPDPNVGGELAIGAAYFFTAGIGASAEVVGDLFYGAATPDVGFAVYPILSAQLGVVVDYELLP